MIRGFTGSGRRACRQEGGGLWLPQPGLLPDRGDREGGVEGGCPDILQVGLDRGRCALCTCRSLVATTGPAANCAGAASRGGRSCCNSVLYSEVGSE